MTQSSYAEALAALAPIIDGLGNCRILADYKAGMLAVKVIREALEAAAAEQRDWGAIHDLVNHVEVTGPGGHVTCWTVTVEVGPPRKYFDGETKAQALHAAAEWARAQQ